MAVLGFRCINQHNRNSMNLGLVFWFKILQLQPKEGRIFFKLRIFKEVGIQGFRKAFEVQPTTSEGTHYTNKIFESLLTYYPLP